MFQFGDKISMLQIYNSKTAKSMERLIQSWIENSYVVTLC